MAALAQAAMGEDDIASLLAAAQKALADSKDHADAVTRASAGAVSACGEFASAKATAERLRGEMQRLDSVAIDIRTLARSVPDCGGSGGTLATDLTEARRLKGIFDKALTDVEAGLQTACTATCSLASDSQLMQVRGRLEENC